jgi:dihydroorotate dehydrogenase (NAD+) catalytic subunit
VTRNGTPAPVDLSTRIGTVALPNPVMTASGTAGHGAELSGHVELSTLGAVVTKSVAAFDWAGNPAPRVAGATGGMLNAVGLQGRGVKAWLHDDVPELVASGARVVASIWGHTVEDFAEAAVALADAPEAVVAVEINLSCPNLEGKGMFAQSADATRDVVAATAACRRPRWAKLTAAVGDVPEIAAAAASAGAEAVTLVNTIPAMAIDVTTRRPVLGTRAGGLSGPAIHPVAVRAVHDVFASVPGLPIVGVGGVTDAVTAVQLVLAGASAVQVGTATFADPRACCRVLSHLRSWCAHHDVARFADLIGAAHVS